MACPRFRKDTGDKRIITGDFTDWLNGSDIASVAYVVPTDLTAANASATTKKATNYFSGGDDGEEYEIDFIITTDEAVPRIKTHTVILEVGSNCAC